MRQYYCVNIFKLLLPESKVNASLHTFCHPCYCHPCYQPKVTGMTSGNRDKNVFSSVTWKLYSGTKIAVVFLKTNILIKLKDKECGDLCMCVNPVTTCHPCYFGW